MRVRNGTQRTSTLVFCAVGGAIAGLMLVAQYLHRRLATDGVAAPAATRLGSSLVATPSTSAVTDSTPPLVPEGERCQILALPSWRPRLHLLTTVNLARCGLRELPPSIGLCTRMRKLDLFGNPLTGLPDELVKCTALDTLFVAGGTMPEMPRVLGRMGSITRLGLKDNGIEVVPGDAIPPNVVHLILTHNSIRRLPLEAFGRLTRVRKLMLANNQLEELPAAGVAKLRALELARLSNNRLASVPTELLSLPRWSWLALAGNPLAPPSPTAVAPEATAAELHVDEGMTLGQGASGKVLGGTYQGRPVAIKGFTVASSDGRAEDELALYAAVAHPALVEVRAVLRSPSLAVIMEQLPKTMRDLAQPPTIVEVTTDRYDTGAQFSDAEALFILRAVASALNYLHGSLGVAHGDVYAHNVLVDSSATAVKLADFGAAFTYAGAARESGLDAGLIQRIEARAFGVLVGELASRIRTQDAAGSSTAADTLTQLAESCMVPTVAARPDFNHIVGVLASVRVAQQ